MAKFELNIYDMKTDEIVKTYQKNRLSLTLYCKFQDLNDKLGKQEIKSDRELFLEYYKDLFLELFPQMTEKEYTENTDPAEILALWNKICETALIVGDSSKN